MLKDFDRWNEKKKGIGNRSDILYFKEGEIWWINLGLNVGFEINGKGEDFIRPVLILRKYNKYSFLALPLSTSKNLNRYKIPIGLVDNKEAVAVLSQVRNIDSRRLINKVGVLGKETFKLIKEKTSQVNFG